jgi:hypothetical protein
MTTFRSEVRCLTAIHRPDTVQRSRSPELARKEVVEPADQDDAGGSTWRFDPATDATGEGEEWPSAWGGQTMDWADWRAGYASQPDEHCYWVDDVDVTGTIPAALEGTYFRNGPGLFEFGGQRLRHPFDGDGLVTALSVSSGRAHFRSRYVRTAERTAEQAAGRLLYPCTFGTYATPSVVACHTQKLPCCVRARWSHPRRDAAPPSKRCGRGSPLFVVHGNESAQRGKEAQRGSYGRCKTITLAWISSSSTANSTAAAALTSETTQGV